MSVDQGNLAGRLDTIGRNVAEIYEPVVQHLHQVRMLARAFEQHVAALRISEEQSGDDAGPETTATVETAALHLRQTIGHAQDILARTELKDLIGRMEADCAQLIRFSRELNSLSFLMLVTTANGISHGFSVDHLVKELRGMADSLKAAGEKISTTLSRVALTRHDAEETLSTAATLIDDSIASLKNGPDIARPDTRETNRIRSPQRMSEELSAEIAHVMPGIVACMQHPDAFAQRCDHTARAAELQQADTTDPVTRQALARLVAAQSDDIRVELDQIQGEALRTLEHITSLSRQTQSGLEQSLAEDQRLKRIAEKQDGINASSDALSHISKVAGAALTDLVACVRMFDEIKETFSELNTMRAAVRMSSMNADLSERRSKVNMPELRSVTKAVGDCANSCGSVMTRLDDGYRRVNALFVRIDQDKINGAIGSVNEQLEQSARELAALSDQVAAFRQSASDCASTLQKIEENGMAAHSRIKANQMTLKQLDTIASQATQDAGDPSGDASPDAAIIQTVFDSYSIERERDVHRATLPDMHELANTGNVEAEGGDDDEEDPLAEFLF